MIAREVLGQLFAHDNIIHTVQVQGWMDSDKYQLWVREVLVPYLNGRYGYLLQDQFSVHMKEENIATTQRAGVEVDFIPAGYTAYLQVLDKGVNKPFKQFIRDHSISWLQQAPQGAKPNRLDVTNWISNSWNQITAETITNTWNSLQLHPFH